MVTEGASVLHYR